MSFDLENFARIRPYVYHLTSEGNVPSIRRQRCLFPARELLHRAGQGHMLRQHRPESISLQIDADTLHIRDQAPLKRGNLALSTDWSFEDVLELLNRRVFFWPGTETGPIPSGERHFGRYADERVSILRVPTADLLAANIGIEPEFCQWNSGAPRWSRGIQPVRRPETFGTASLVAYRASQVIELTFTGTVQLPSTAQLGPTATGPWRKL